jgi:hypothetical protein
VVLRRLDLVGRVRRGGQEPRGVRRVLLQPGRGPALGGRLRRHRHRLGVPQRLRQQLRHQRPGRVQERDGRDARQIRPEQPGHRRDHGRRLVRRQDRRSRLRGRRELRRLVQPDDVRLLRRLGGPGPDGPALAAHLLQRHPPQGFYTDAAIQKLGLKGVPASKLLLGIGFYGRGWTGVSQAAPGGTATGAAPGTYEAGIEDYKVLKTRCPANGKIAGTAYAHCGNEWWSYDTPDTIAGKMTYKQQQGLGGTFFWELSGDTGNGELIKAIT